MTEDRAPAIGAQAFTARAGEPAFTSTDWMD